MKLLGCHERSQALTHRQDSAAVRKGVACPWVECGGQRAIRVRDTAGGPAVLGAAHMVAAALGAAADAQGGDPAWPAAC